MFSQPVHPAYLAGQRLRMRRCRVRVVIEQPAGGQHHARVQNPHWSPWQWRNPPDRVAAGRPFEAFHP